MNIKENIRIALRALNANKLRAALTMLGIMIGVAAVITLLAIGDGVTRFVADQFIGLGTNLVFVLPNMGDEGQIGPPGMGGDSTLTMNDAVQLTDPVLLPNVSLTASLVFRSDDLQYRGTAYRTTIRASTPDYAAIRGYVVARGRYISETDYNGRSRVVVLGQDVVDNL